MRCLAMTLAMLLVVVAAGLSQSYDAADSAPPPTHSENTMHEMASPLIETYSLLIMPPCRDADPQNGSDLSVNLVTRGGFEPLNITMGDDSVVVMKLRSTGSVRRINAKSDFRFPYSFDLLVVFDADTAAYHVCYDIARDSFRVSEDSRNRKIGFIRLEPIGVIPADYSWVMFNAKSGKWLREFRDKMAGIAEFITLKEGYYKCLPSFVEKTNSANMTVNQAGGMIIQFFKSKNHALAGLEEMIRQLPHIIAYRLN